MSEMISHIKYKTICWNLYVEVYEHKILLDNVLEAEIVSIHHVENIVLKMFLFENSTNPIISTSQRIHLK